MFSAFRGLTERLLRIPGEPEPPPGDEASTRRFRAAPNCYYYLLVTWTLRTVILLVALLPAEILPLLGAFTESFERKIPSHFSMSLPPLIAGLIILQRLFSLALLRLDFEKRWYLVTDRSLRVREGVLLIREMTITIANIQNISVSQGPIQRLLGIADLRVDTAGGGDGAAKKSDKEGKENLHGVRFRGVNNAEEVRLLINTRLRELRDAGLGDIEDRTAAPRPHPRAAGDPMLAALREIAAEASALRAVV
ncbi:MAG: PH domain-containing protein [Chthoniobacterales bacterium]